MLHTIQELRQRQALPLEVKIQMSKARIREWIEAFGVDGVYISFSGGKDSTVLLHLVREEYPDCKAMFVDTGLEYPEIKDFVKTFDNVDIVRPKMSFKQVIEKYGYPFISKEVSESVFGAKKYLTELAKAETITSNERTNERTNERRLPYAYRYEKLYGLGRYAKKKVSKPRGRTKPTAFKNDREISEQDSGEIP